MASFISITFIDVKDVIPSTYNSKSLYYNNHNNNNIKHLLELIIHNGNININKNHSKYFLPKAL